jgi:hypothetical protein
MSGFEIIIRTFANKRIESLEWITRGILSSPDCECDGVFAARNFLLKIYPPGQLGFWGFYALQKIKNEPTGSREKPPNRQQKIG